MLTGSLFCRSPAKQEALLRLMQRLLKSLNETGAFPPLHGESGSPEPAPDAKQWVLFYLAQHYDKTRETGDQSSFSSQALLLVMELMYCEIVTR